MIRPITFWFLCFDRGNILYFLSMCVQRMNFEHCTLHPPFSEQLLKEKKPTRVEIYWYGYFSPNNNQQPSSLTS